MNIMRYVGLYLIAGFVLHAGWAIVFAIWIHSKVGGKNFSEAMCHHLWLKMRLYEKNIALREVKVAIEEMLSKNAAGFILWIALSIFVWPIGLFENFAVYSDMCDYVYDVAQGKKSSES